MTSETPKTPKKRKAKEYKSDIKPVWCPGCGDFSVLSALSKALATLELPPEQVSLLSGIGCSSRLPAYMKSYGFHGVHGRVLPLATGLKAARPDLTVIAAGGDGDGFSIGGNHFLHACRRNMDITYLVMDNEVYGMTKGQASPTTEANWTHSKLTPHGTQMRPFKPAAIALAAGASFIARGFAGNPSELTKMIIDGIQHPGFSFIQILSPCRTYRPEQMAWKEQVHPWPEIAIDFVSASRQLEVDDDFSIGVLYNEPIPVWKPYKANQTSLEELEAGFRVVSA